jgi:hypothetical protein
MATSKKAILCAAHLDQLLREASAKNGRKRVGGLLTSAPCEACEAERDAAADRRRVTDGFLRS